MLRLTVLLCTLALLTTAAWAGRQMYEPMSASMRAGLQASISDHAVPYLAFDSESEARTWLDAMSRRLVRRIPDRVQREEFLVTVHYEARRAGLDPQMVLGLIQVESNFRKYAVSSAGARGYMQVMPFWVGVIGAPGHNLFHLRTNLRYGCVILKHYMDIENGDLFRALGRYNGSLGRAEYPNMVLRAWRDNWHYPVRTADAPPGGRG
ncbi:MAG: lytic transglycosylase domain-containing protein [Burkholderiales bacterium]|nr:lytic transglycosylase domain-containing protein [Burkholderiales bacterium]